MEEQLVELLSKLNNGIDNSILFTQEHLPDVIQELLMWYAIKSGLLCLLGIAFVITWVLLDIKLFKFVRTRDDETELLIGYIGIGSFIRIMGLCGLESLISFDWLQILIAPKLWIIEYTAQLVK